MPFPNDGSLHTCQVEVDRESRPLQLSPRGSSLLTRGHLVQSVSGMRNTSKELPGATSRYAPCGECPANRTRVAAEGWGVLSLGAAWGLG